MSNKPFVSVDFTANGNFRMMQSSGWSAPEPHGVWSSAAEAKIVVAGLRAKMAHRAEILATPFVMLPSVAGQTVVVHCAGRELFSDHLAGPGRICFTIPAEAVSEVGIAELTFWFPGAIAPRELGSSGDVRKLSFSFFRAEFYLKTDEAGDGGNGRPSELAITPNDLPAKVVHEGERMPIKRNSLHRCWKELSVVVDGLFDGPMAQHIFMQKFFAFLGGDEQVYIQFVRSVQAAYERSILGSLDSPLATSRIPPLTHRIWITGHEVALPPQEYVDNYLKSTKALPSSAMHFFWTNSADVRDHIANKGATFNCTNIFPMDISFFGDESLFPSLRKLIEARKFVLAADVLKFMILHRLGGIYSDLGVLYDEAIFSLVRTAEYGLIVSSTWFFQTSFVASPPGSDLVSIFLAVLNNPQALSAEYAKLGKAVTALDEVHIYAGLGFTACVLLFLSPSCRTVILPAQSNHMQWRSERSWYGAEAKHGNVLVERTAASVISDEQYRVAKEKTSANLQFFGHDPALAEKLHILLIAEPYFRNNQTRFCRVFSYHGSDKAYGWHNYGYVYNFILGQHRDRIRRIVEIGMGTNYLDVPSSMGVTGIPGASLRAWKELFPLASVVGADIDRRILFQDERIETYFVDQTQPETLAALFQQVGEAPVDLVVDDGLHTFEANLNVYRAAYPRISPGGFLVIEDVRNEDVPRWAELLAAADHVGAIVQLPHPNNQTDNCLVLIPGKTRQ